MPIWLIFALGTVFCWGAYGTAIHKSNVLLGHGMKTILLVGVAYFFLAVLIPGIYIMSKQAIDWSFPTKGLMFGLLAGSLGALGAICVTFAMRPESGGNPLFVMPIIFKVSSANSAGAVAFATSGFASITLAAPTTALNTASLLENAPPFFSWP